MILCRPAGGDGEPLGKGKAWHVASRNDLPFQRDFFAAIINELALPRAIEGISRRVWWQQRARTAKPPGVCAEL
jgi:beta-galactosidase GanA